MWDLEKQELQLKDYQQTSTSLSQWIDNARNRQDALQSVKLNDIQTLMDHLNQQKACIVITNYIIDAESIEILDEHEEQLNVIRNLV